MKDNRFDFGCGLRVCDPENMTVAEFAKALRSMAIFLESLESGTESKKISNEKGQRKYFFMEACATLWDGSDDEEIYLRDECILSSSTKGSAGANEDFLPILKIPNITIGQAIELYMLRRLMVEKEWYKPREFREDIEKFAKNRKQEIYTEIVEAGL